MEKEEEEAACPEAQVWVNHGMREEPGEKGVTAVLEGEDDLCALGQRSWNGSHRLHMA